MKEIELFIPCIPIPKGRPRFNRMGSSYTPARTRNYEKEICIYYSEHCSYCFGNAIKIFLTFYMPIPKATSKKKRLKMLSGEIKHTVKTGDLDNLCKAVTDALNTVAYIDDSQITTIHAHKCYGETPGIMLKIVEDSD